MNHPLRASRAPSRGLSRDTGGPADRPRQAKGRAAKPGAACKTRQRPGQAGSAALAGFGPAPRSRATIPRAARPAGGFSLLVILVMTAVLSLLALGAMNSSVVQERMAGNARDRNIALQAAEAALRDAEQDIETNITSGSVFTDTCANGLCIPSSDTASAPSSVPLWQTVNWATTARAYGSGTGAPALLGPGNAALATQPRYLIERLPSLPPRPGYESACVGGGCSNVAAERARAYRITVRASGIRSATEVMLQSVYVKQ